MAAGKQHWYGLFELYVKTAWITTKNFFFFSIIKFDIRYCNEKKNQIKNQIIREQHHFFFFLLPWFKNWHISDFWSSVDFRLQRLEASRKQQTNRIWIPSVYIMYTDRFYLFSFSSSTAQATTALRESGTYLIGIAEYIIIVYESKRFAFHIFSLFSVCGGIIIFFSSVLTVKWSFEHISAIASYTIHIMYVCSL